MSKININVLASGSTGNCYVIEGINEHLLIEPGIKFEKIRKTMRKNLKQVVGVLVSHSHKDHCLSVNHFADYGFDIYCSKGTLDGMNHLVHKHNVNILESLKEYEIGSEWIVLPFDTKHDCEGSQGFFIHNKVTDERIVFITDSYYVQYTFDNVDYFMIECNYILKDIEGILSEIPHSSRLLESHMSLENCIKTLKANDLSKTKRIFLLHMSTRHCDSNKIRREVTNQFGLPVVVAGID